MGGIGKTIDKLIPIAIVTVFVNVINFPNFSQGGVRCMAPTFIPTIRTNHALPNLVRQTVCVDNRVTLFLRCTPHIHVDMKSTSPVNAESHLPGEFTKLSHVVKTPITVQNRRIEFHAIHGTILLRAKNYLVANVFIAITCRRFKL
jgi:hypothetical protein